MSIDKLPCLNPIFSVCRERKATVFVLAATLVLCVVVVDITARFAPGFFAGSATTPVLVQRAAPTMGQPTYDLQAITSVHLFGVATAPPGKAARPTQTRLPLQLVGVIAGTNQRFARVLIGLESETPKSYTLGQTIRGTDARVHAIESGRAVLQRGAVLEQLDLERPTLSKRNDQMSSPERMPQAHPASAPPADPSVAVRKPQATVDQRRFKFF